MDFNSYWGSVFFLGDYENAGKTLREAMKCTNAIGNPFIHLRLGQVQLELKNLERAKDNLAMAYIGGGKEILEDEYPKYFAFIGTFLKIV